ncbi:hypothetical protein HY495_00735 [Candidatus Woesearchaeota archaeon]|nr:hypothetical protein [Candidatus Woesearchaeota archaeon]
MNGLAQLKERLQKQHLSPDVLKDQHFCIDETIFQTILQTAELKKNDVVAEIGPGPGILTKAIAQKVKKVIAVEIDRSLTFLLDDLPKNVELVFANALAYLPRRTDFNKLISNLPYQICEPILQYLTKAKNIEHTVLTVPNAFASKVQRHPIFSSFFEITLIKEVPKEAFYPQPKVLSAIITISPLEEPTDSQYLIQKLHLQRDKKLRNGLRDALIDLYKKRERTLTKKQAAAIISSVHLSEKMLDTLIAKLPLGVYEELLHDTFI